MFGATFYKRTSIKYIIYVYIINYNVVERMLYYFNEPIVISRVNGI